MRIAFLVLLLANLLVFGWMQRQSPPAAAPNDRVAGAGTPRILLTNEAAGPAAPAPMGVATPAGVASRAAGQSRTGAPARPVDLDAGLRRCVSLGPYAGPDSAAQAAAMLRRDGYQPRQRAADGKAAEDYMVRIAPLKSEAEQARVVARLKRGGLNDAYPLRKLKEGYAVSVGIFSQPQRAERRVLAVARMGFKAQVVKRERPGTVYWIDFDLPAPASGAASSGSILKVSGLSPKGPLTPCPESRPVG